MKRPAVFVPFVLACGLAIGVAGQAPGRGRTGALSLIRIPKDPSLSPAVLTRLGTDVRQELSTCLIALADGGELVALRRNGVRFTVLVRNASGREVMLVETRRPEALAALRAAGRAVAVEPATALFWTGGRNAAEAVPAGLPRKSLSARSVRRFLPARPAGAEPPAASSAPDPAVEAIIAPVSTASLAASVQALEGFQTRYASTANCEAAGDFIYGSLAALGLDDVRLEAFSFAGGFSSRNVVAEKTGTTYPSDVFIVCAHYDSTSPSRLTLAPGADDNGSGVAAVLEAARIMAPHEFDFSVRFIAFSAEEWGLYGSAAYAAAARAAGQRILGVVNLDMIAYADAVPEDLSLIVNSRSGWLADLFLSAGASYGPVAGVKTVDPSIIYSDHSPFWDNGYPALLAIEDYPLTNPYYHRTSDTLGTLDLDFLTRAARASAGLAAELAQPVRAGYPPTPTGLTAAWVTYRSLFSALPIVRLAWTAGSGAAGYNVYRATSTHGDLTKLNEDPVIVPEFSDSRVALGSSYFYVVTAIGPTGLESNRSREVSATPALTQAMSLVVGPSILRGIR